MYDSSTLTDIVTDMHGHCLECQGVSYPARSLITPENRGRDTVKLLTRNEKVVSSILTGGSKSHKGCKHHAIRSPMSSTDIRTDMGTSRPSKTAYMGLDSPSHRVPRLA